MHVTFRQLKVFQAVARRGSFTAAAGELHLTQPAVSMQIRQLETNIGLSLFEHLGKKIYLTEAGEELYDYSRRIAQLVDEAGEVLEQLKGAQRGQLAISVASTANHFATRLLAGFTVRYPGVSFSLDVTNRETLLQQLKHNERDLVIMGKPPPNEELLAQPFLDNPLVVIAPPEHPLTHHRRIPLKRLAQESFVVREPGSGTRGAAERFFARFELQFTPGMEMSSNEAIKHAVEAGLGLAVVSAHTLEVELAARRLRILDVKGFPIKRHWYVVQRADKRLSPVAQAFRSFVLEEAQGYVVPLDALTPPPAVGPRGATGTEGP
jgi:DNA-binding transcriptional LysR family regulator